MVNWWLILLAVLIGLGLLGLSFYSLFYYQSEEVVLMLPYDVAAYSSPVQPSTFSSPINTEVVLWMAVPLAMFYYVFYYEAFDPEETIAERKIAGGHSSLFRSVAASSPTPKSCGFTKQDLLRPVGEEHVRGCQHRCFAQRRVPQHAPSHGAAPRPLGRRIVAAPQALRS